MELMRVVPNLAAALIDETIIELHTEQNMTNAINNAAQTLGQADAEKALWVYRIDDHHATQLAKLSGANAQEVPKRASDSEGLLQWILDVISLEVEAYAVAITITNEMSNFSKQAFTTLLLFCQTKLRRI